VTAYILRRLLLMIPTLLGITIVVFTVMAASPGGISAQSLIEGQNLEPEAKRALEDYYNRLYGLNSPPPVQYLRWLNNVMPIGFVFDHEHHIAGFSFTKGSNLGMSFRYGRPVLELIKERLPITLLLNLLSIPLIYLIAITFGVRAATDRGGGFDRLTSITMLGLWSVPTMLTGVLLIGFFASEQYWQWFPTAGLSQRTALDMPFMPHWSNLWDALLLGVSALLGTGLMVALARFLRRTGNLAIMAVLGVAGGLWMVDVLPQAGWVLWVLLPVALGTMLGLLGWTGFTSLRVAAMGLTGLFAGVLLASYFVDGGFVRGFLFDRLWHLVLPVLCLTYGGFAFLAKLTRSAVLENLHADYARTARAKGVPERQVLWRHVFRNSLLPLITVSASLLPSLLAGSVIVESLFSIDGMGKLAVEAVQGRDRELVLSITLISGLLTLISYLIADILYAMVDPRVSYE
jgi:ABC-type dipeptide/oligopeptide/nickel transport system permease component